MAYTERVNRAIDHVVGRLDRPLSLKAMAKAAALSPFHFHRVFQMIVGQTPADFVRRVRLERALAMMSATAGRGRRKGGGGASITDIAHECGFSSVSEFSRSFRQRYGASPSKFDLEGWQREHREELERLTNDFTGRLHVERLGPRVNPDSFKVRIRDLPARTVAYIRVRDPYKPGAVVEAVERLVAWADERGLGGGQWLGYQWENPELVPLEDCTYHAAVEAEGFTPEGEIGRYRFPAMTVAQVEIRGGIDLELRALQWLMGTWLPRSGYVPDDQPCFEAWMGRPFAHGMEHFELYAWLPVRRG